MDAMRTCPKCESNKIIRNARVVDHEDGYELDLQVEVCERPDAKFDVERNPHHGVARANVCGACGYTELFVEGHEELWATYRRSAAPERGVGLDRLDSRASPTLDVRH